LQPQQPHQPIKRDIKVSVDFCEDGIKVVVVGHGDTPAVGFGARVSQKIAASSACDCLMQIKEMGGTGC
jgi:hypothetical protein